MKPSIIFIVLILVTLAGCRYWSLYRFGDQFCEYNRFVSLNERSASASDLPYLQLAFSEPVLPRNVLLRYLKAEPAVTRYQSEASKVSSVDYMADTLRIMRVRADVNASIYTLGVNYDLAGDTPLLARVDIDAHISQLFTAEVVAPILKSICSDDYDLGRKRIEMRFSLNDINVSLLPMKNKLFQLFGVPDEITDEGHLYQFDFLKTNIVESTTEVVEMLQNKPIMFNFAFDQYDVLSRIHIVYLNYDYLLDFSTMSGRLIVVRE